jgi:hypothetical protein
LYLSILTAVSNALENSLAALSNMRMLHALAEFRQQLSSQSRLGFQTVVVSYQLAIDPDTLHTCGQGV